MRIWTRRQTEFSNRSFVQTSAIGRLQHKADIRPLKGINKFSMDCQAELTDWGVQFVQVGGVTLVKKSDAADCIKRVYSENCRFLGYDAFTLRSDGKIQPHLQWSADYSKGSPSLENVLARMKDHPDSVTHYEFVFRCGE